MKRPIPIVKVLKVLEKLESHQYPQEPKPVGGYGAGVAILQNNGRIMLEKVGKVEFSPAKHLAEIVNVNEVSILVGHVRMPSPQFMGTAKFKETAQPYVAKCYKGLTVISAHNGNVTNYREIRQKLDKSHTFESEKVELIDSEVIPHFFEELIKEKADTKKALDVLFSALEGPNTISVLQIGEDGAFLHFVHKGKTRGLTVWTNKNGNIIFCSRKEPLVEEFGDIIVRGKFKEKVSILYREEKNLRISFFLGEIKRAI